MGAAGPRARRALHRALRRGGGAGLALGAVERAGHQLLARHSDQFNELYDRNGGRDQGGVARGRGRRGPAITATWGRAPGPGIPPWLPRLLRPAGDEPLDFVSFHTKDSLFTPWRVYAVRPAPPPSAQSVGLRRSLTTLREFHAALGSVAVHPRFRRPALIVDECDASVPAHFGRFDNRQLQLSQHRVLPRSSRRS